MNTEVILKSYGIRPTAIRMMFLRCLQQNEEALTFDEISELLDTVDRSTIFRTLSLFEKRDLVHRFEDGIGNVRHCLLVVEHVHITCTCCGKTYTLPIEHYPQISIPENFKVERMKFVVTGVCNECQSR